MVSASDFWDFSLAVYQQPGVQNECLELQERCDVDVNLLLLCAYLGGRHSALLRGDDIAAAVAASAGWHNEVVRSLRAARIALKSWSAGRDQAVSEQANTLRNAVKTLELDAERIEHELLVRWAADAELGTAPAETALASNIRALLDHYGPTSGAPLPRHLIAAALARTA